MRPGTNSCGCSQGEGATAIVTPAATCRRESRVTSTAAAVVSVDERFGPTKFEGSGVSRSPSVGREGSDHALNENAQESPVPSTRGTGTGEARPPPVLGGGEAARIKWTAEGPTRTVCTHFMAWLSLPGQWGWRLRLRILFFLWLMINM